MNGILGRVRDTLHVPGQSAAVDADTLVNRLTAIQRFLRAADGQLPDDRLVPAHTLVERAGTRLALSREHTVVALAGSTGSGKSSLFNALAQLYLSPVGVRRPTTGVTYACVWGATSGATTLLDWVGVLPRHRFLRESALDADDEASMHGLVLLDLPDFDSVDRAHRVEVDRLLGLVDLVIWVVDPQKYADTVIHDSYLRQFRRHRDVTVVVLNHADRLAPDDVRRCLDDLRALLDDDGLSGVPTFATSAHQPEALAELRALLERTVAGRQAVLHRLAGDLDCVVAGLAGLVGPPVAADAVDPGWDSRLTGKPGWRGGSTGRHGGARALADALAAAAGVPAVADATERAYRYRAGAVMGWPPVRWLHRLRADPLRRLHLTSGTSGARTAAPATTGPVPPAGPADPSDVAAPVPVTSIPAPAPVQQSAVNLAVRATAERAGQQLPEPWPAAVAAAARSRLADLPDALDRAIVTTGPDLLARRCPRRGAPGSPGGNPPWWRLIGAVQWLATALALFGLLWLGAGLLLQLIGLPALDYPTIGVLPLPTALLFGGLLAGYLLSVLVHPVVRFAARRAGARIERQLRVAVAEVGREYVVAPVRDVLHRYTEAREALLAAGGAPTRDAPVLNAPALDAPALEAPARGGG